MSEKTTLGSAQAALERAHHVLAVLEGASADWRLACGIDLDTYRQGAADLATAAASLEAHLSALEALLPEVHRQTRDLSRSNKKAARTLVRALHGRPLRRGKRAQVVIEAETAELTDVVEPPTKRRPSRAKTTPPAE